MGHTIIITLRAKRIIHKQVKKLTKVTYFRSDLIQSAVSSQSFNFHTLVPQMKKVIGVIETKVQ